jgi:hypothetical protein
MQDCLVQGLFTTGAWRLGSWVCQTSRSSVASFGCVGSGSSGSNPIAPGWGCRRLAIAWIETSSRLPRGCIGDGIKATFWESTWFGDAPLRHSFPLSYAHSRCKWRSVAQALQDNKWVADLRHNPTPILQEFLQAWRMIALAAIELQPG